MNETDTAIAAEPVSYSRINSWLLCPRRYQYRYIEAAPEERLSGNLVFGSAIHEALEAFMNSLATEPLSLDETVGVFERALKDEVEFSSQLSMPVDWGKKSLDEMCEKGRQMLAVFLDKVDRNVRVVGTEVPFEVPVAPDVMLKGVIDMIVALDDDRYLVVDFKTAASSLPPDKLQHDMQPTAYLLAAELMMNAPGKVEFEFWTLTKTKSPALRISPVQRTAEQKQEFLEAIRDVAVAEEVGLYPRRRSFMCTGCEFADRCNGEVK